MKSVCIVLICLFAFSSKLLAQTSDSLKNKVPKEASVDLSGIVTPVLSRDFYGFNLDFKYFPVNRVGTGLYFAYAQKKIADTFNYSIGKPKIDYYEVGWINQYNFFKADKVRLNVNLTNGISIARLGDASIKEKHRGRYGYTYDAKEIATNYYYLLEPGADFLFKLLSFNHNPDIWITTKAKYRFLFGDNKYGAHSQFSGYLFGVGISLIGNITDAKPIKK